MSAKSDQKESFQKQTARKVGLTFFTHHIEPKFNDRCIVEQLHPLPHRKPLTTVPDIYISSVHVMFTIRFQHSIDKMQRKKKRGDYKLLKMVMVFSNDGFNTYNTFLLFVKPLMDVEFTVG